MNRPFSLHQLLLAVSASGVLLLTGCGGSSGNSSGATAAAERTSKRSTATATSEATKTSAATTVTSSTASSAGVASAQADGVTATLHAGTRHPTVERPWPIHFEVTRGGRRVEASVRYEYLLGSQVVARRSHYVFRGRFSDVFKWPPAAVGYPLTFRAVIAVGRVTLDLDYPVQVAR